MRFSENWLREWVKPNISTQDLANQLSMAGLEVDSVEPAADDFQNVVIGEIVEIDKHPDAEKLSVCIVSVGKNKSFQIVCGANNIYVGAKVPLALIRASLPKSIIIKKTKIRGIYSDGMICSASELGLTDVSEGILTLNSDAPIGKDFWDFLNLNDRCIEVDLTPDRGDCLSVLGIAREVSAINDIPMEKTVFEDISIETDDAFNVRVAAHEACPRYLCRIIKDIDPKAETPLWMTERLRRGGIRSISAIVDITNYVLLELGQPMHGFDYSKIKDELLVRYAENNEKLELLDGQKIDLREDTLIIADKNGPLALAGIMGGLVSAVTMETKDIILESAFFHPLSVAGIARSYALHTDSSHRFERGVDYELPELAMKRASALILEIAGGKAGPIKEISSEQNLPKRESICLRYEKIEKVLGINIKNEKVEQILSRLNMDVLKNDSGWSVTPPSFRFDIEIEVDLIEEIGRIFGYENIPLSFQNTGGELGSVPEGEFDLEKAKQILVNRDFQEAITYSFISPEMSNMTEDNMNQIKLANPISADMSIMRTSILPGLISSISYNKKRQQDRVRFFESGLTFRLVGNEIEQKEQLAAAICGSVYPEQWNQNKKPADFYDLKNDLIAILSQVGDYSDFSFIAKNNQMFHPGQSSQVLLKNNHIGWLGMLHPKIQDTMGLSEVFMFEIAINKSLVGNLPEYKTLSKFPFIRRDLAITVGKKVTFGEVLSIAWDVAPNKVKDIQLFDVYIGENIDSDTKVLL